jgi:hypothetical protein
MNRLARMFKRYSIATTVGFAALFWSGDIQLSEQTVFTSSAEARVGRPATPMSYAGVARRTTRRAVAVGAATRPVVVVPAPAVVCTQAVNAYGQIVRVCR